MAALPDVRVRDANDRPVDPSAEYVVYWMIAARRPSWNFALDRAIAWARLLRKPLVVLEALRVDYPWASDRLHRFVLDGMADNARAFANGPTFGRSMDGTPIPMPGISGPIRSAMA